MSDIVVDTARRILTHRNTTIACLIGKNGAVAPSAKREGDGATPLGRWPIRAVLLRPDRISAVPALRVPWRWLRANDGWSDDPNDAAYNRPVQHPYARSAEHLWRNDQAYDVIVALGHNDMPPAPGAGSAIFLHCTADREFTDGCVAIARSDLIAMLPQFAPADVVDIR